MGPQCFLQDTTSLKNKAPSPCGDDDAPDVVIEFKNHCPGKATALMNTCYAETDHDTTITAVGGLQGAHCNDNLETQYCIPIYPKLKIAEKYLVDGMYVSCRTGNPKKYGDGSSGSMKCSAMAYEMQPVETVRLIISSYKNIGGNVVACNRL